MAVPRESESTLKDGFGLYLFSLPRGSLLSQGFGLVLFTRGEALPCDQKCGLQEVSVQVFDSVSRPFDFFSYATIAEHLAGHLS